MSTAEWIDISVPLETGMVCWPGSVGFKLISTLSLDAGDPANNSKIETDVHIGTHVDAPSHSIAGGSTVDAMSLDVLIGPARVVALENRDTIDGRALEEAGIPQGTKRLLIRTRNSDLWNTRQTRFVENFVGLTADASEWIVRRGIGLVGIDYLSIQSFGQGSMRTHDIMLAKNIVIVEGLKLTGIQEGEYEMACLPLKIVGAEGAPARAVLRRSRL